MLHQNNQITSKSRSGSSRSLKSTASSTRRAHSTSPTNDANKVPELPKTNTNSITVKEQTLKRDVEQQKKTKRNLTGTFGNKSLLNFQMICEEVLIMKRRIPNQKHWLLLLPHLETVLPREQKVLWQEKKENLQNKYVKEMKQGN